MTKQLSLPDFDDMMRVSDEIADYMLAKDQLELQIKEKVESVYRIVSVDTKYFVGGKPPATSYIKETYEFSGLNGEIKALREGFAIAKANLSRAQNKFEVMKMMVDLYRTESANKRATL